MHLSQNFLSPGVNGNCTGLAEGSRNDGWLKAQKSCPQQLCLHILGGKGAILLFRLACCALLHPFIHRMKNFKVESAERKLRWLFCGFAGLDCVYPVKELSYGPLIAASGLGGELHSGSLRFGDSAFFSVDCYGDPVVRGLHDEGGKVF